MPYVAIPASGERRLVHLADVERELVQRLLLVLRAPATPSRCSGPRSRAAPSRRARRRRSPRSRLVRNVLSPCDVVSAACAPSVCATSSAARAKRALATCTKCSEWDGRGELHNAVGVPIVSSARHVTRDMIAVGTDCALLDGHLWSSGRGRRAWGRTPHRRRITMGYRVFTDSQGTEWQAWDVVPQLTERREVERRVRIVPVPHADRRRDPDRRDHQRTPAHAHGGTRRRVAVLRVGPPRSADSRRSRPTGSAAPPSSSSSTSIGQARAAPSTAAELFHDARSPAVLSELERRYGAPDDERHQLAA